MDRQRRRDPPPPQSVCLYCGWSGTPNHSFLRDQHGGVSLIVSAKRCPNCGRKAIRVPEPKPTLPVQIVTAIRDANLTADELSQLANAIREAPDDASPRALGEKVPFAARVISVASRAEKNWLQLLAIAIAIVAIYVAHSDSEQAHRDSEAALEEARRSRTGGITKEEIQELARRIEQKLDDINESEPPGDARHRP